MDFFQQNPNFGWKRRSKQLLQFYPHSIANQQNLDVRTFWSQKLHDFGEPGSQNAAIGKDT